MAVTRSAVIATVIVLTLTTGWIGVCWAQGRFRPDRTSSTAIAQGGYGFTSSGNLPAAGAQRFLIGRDASAYWLFLPSAQSRRLAPVVFFMHGWMAIEPYFYGGWIDHLLNQGYIVVYPVFQTSKSDTPQSMRQNAVLALKDAVAQLDSGTYPVRPDWSRLSIVGHSFGGGLSTLTASDARSAGLPIPRFVLALAPGWRGGQLPSQELARFPPSTYLLVVQGGDDELASSRQASVIVSSTSHLPESRKQLLVLRTENNIPINHSAPLAPLEAYRNPALSPAEIRRQKIATFIFNRLYGQKPGTIDFIDYNGYWKLFDSANQALDRGDSPFSVLSTTFQKVSGKGTLVDPRRAVVRP